MFQEQTSLASSAASFSSNNPFPTSIMPSTSFENQTNEFFNENALNISNGIYSQSYTTQSNANNLMNSNYYHDYLNFTPQINSVVENTHNNHFNVPNTFYSSQAFSYPTNSNSHGYDFSYSNNSHGYLEETNLQNCFNDATQYYNNLEINNVENNSVNGINTNCLNFLNNNLTSNISNNVLTSNNTSHTNIVDINMSSNIRNNILSVNNKNDFTKMNDASDLNKFLNNGITKNQKINNMSSASVVSNLTNDTTQNKTKITGSKRSNVSPHFDQLCKKRQENSQQINDVTKSCQFKQTLHYQPQLSHQDQMFFNQRIGSQQQFNQSTHEQLLQQQMLFQQQQQQQFLIQQHYQNVLQNQCNPSIQSPQVRQPQITSQTQEHQNTEITLKRIATAANLTQTKPNLLNQQQKQEQEKIRLLMDQMLTRQRLDPNVMMLYLKNPEIYDCVVSIFHAKVSQKSYSTEKRFCCPPPCVYLLGEGWNRRKKRIEQLIPTEYSQKYFENLKQCTSVPSTSNSKNLNIAGLCGQIEIRDAPDHVKLDLDFSKEHFAAAKSLFVSDAENIKYFSLNVNLYHKIFDGLTTSLVGSFESQRIKVISKPGKRKQAVKNNECRYLSILSGSKIALFNRLRSQTVSTRYLHVENNVYFASPRKWSAFTIHLDTEDENNSAYAEEFFELEGYIYYGAVIKLVDSVSNFSLPQMKIRRVEKNNVILDSGETEPVSQLHTCAFQLVDDELSYLSLNNDNIIYAQAERNPTNSSVHLCSDGAAWKITSADVVEYRFYEAMSLSTNFITPAPLIRYLRIVCANSADALLYVHGKNFSTEIKIWLGCNEIKTKFFAKQQIRCKLPLLTDLAINNNIIYKNNCSNNEVLIPFSLVRQPDGIIYGTSKFIVYEYLETNLSDNRKAFPTCVREIKQSI